MISYSVFISNFTYGSKQLYTNSTNAGIPNPFVIWQPPSHSSAVMVFYHLICIYFCLSNWSIKQKPGSWFNPDNILLKQKQILFSSLALTVLL